ncbi:MAG: DUF1254 domain-containing protein [Candidatus Competibacteraceae bacterium]|nr:DUF1254 domain-containing protein [Candidatus Competibacteraceae bacterium]MCB1808139.1 DUF1254 domain-containing protein [Candidatus Competibacteraceae bacterium]MCB1811482.1 DUF1254 domain-containing protein [Candidatus Competibacteraceae bacterium]
MQPKTLITLAVSGLLSVAITAPVQAGNVQETYLGKLEYQDQSITKKTAEFLHRQILLQRATQLVTWAMPMMNFEQLYPALLSNMKAAEDDIFFGLYDGYDGVYPFMTANVTTPYTIAFSDLSKTGPVVVELPPGAIYGVVDNAWMQPIHEIDGKPGKLLLVGPGQDHPKDFDGKIVQSDTFRVVYFYRALGTGDEAKQLRTAVQAYKLSDAAKPPETKFVKYEPKPGDKIALNTQPRDMRFWELVDAYVQREPMADRDRFFYAWLKDLGIEKGKPFKPTDEQKEILQQALDVGMAMSQAISFNKSRNMFPTSLYGKDSGFEDAMAGMDPKIDLPTYSMFNERASYGFEATTTSAGMVSRVPGKGSAYLGSYYDAGGNALMGANNYKLHIGPNPPAANFWSVTVYDIENRLIIRNEIKRSDRSSRTEGLIKNTDGSVDLYFGPKAPEGNEPNWIQTNAGQSFFVYLRLYGPEQAYFDQSFLMIKIQKIK